MMDEKDKISVDCRKLQEAQENFLKSGFHKEVAKWRKALYEAYVDAGFTSEQALELLKAEIKK